MGGGKRRRRVNKAKEHRSSVGRRESLARRGSGGGKAGKVRRR